jgi:hypothetical protein
MYEVVILNLKTNTTFKKTFSSLYLLDKFKKKVKYSTKIKIIAEFKF